MRWLDWLEQWQLADTILREAQRMQTALSRNVTFAATQDEWQTMEQAGRYAAFLEEAYAGDMAELRIGKAGQAECRFHEGNAMPLHWISWKHSQTVEALTGQVVITLAEAGVSPAIVVIYDRHAAHTAEALRTSLAETGDVRACLWYWDEKDARKLDCA